MSRKRSSVEQIINHLCEAEILLGQGKRVGDVQRRRGPEPIFPIGWLEEIRETDTAQLAAASVVEIVTTGYPFHKRCPMAIEGTCDTTEPPVRPLLNGHRIAYHREIAELGH